MKALAHRHRLLLRPILRRILQSRETTTWQRRLLPREPSLCGAAGPEGNRRREACTATLQRAAKKGVARSKEEAAVEQSLSRYSKKVRESRSSGPRLPRCCC